MAITLELPIRPDRFSAGRNLPAGACHVVAVPGGYSVQRTIGAALWFPLTAREDPVWLIWPTREGALQWIEDQSVDLPDYPFWGAELR